MDRKEYMRNYMRERYKQFRERAIAFLGGKCVKCSSTEDLQLDHTDRTTRAYNVSSLARNWEGNLPELRKCQLLCEKCHIEKTREERGLKNAFITHGTISSYRYCKCELCRKAKSEHNKAYVIKRRGSSAGRAGIS